MLFSRMEPFSVLARGALLSSISSQSREATTSSGQRSPVPMLGTENLRLQAASFSFLPSSEKFVRLVVRADCAPVKHLGSPLPPFRHLLCQAVLPQT